MRAAASSPVAVALVPVPVYTAVPAVGEAGAVVPTAIRTMTWSKSATGGGVQLSVAVVKPAVTRRLLTGRGGAFAVRKTLE